MRILSISTDDSDDRDARPAGRRAGNVAAPRQGWASATGRAERPASAPQGQKGAPPPQAQKGAPPPQAQQQLPFAPPAPYTALAVAPPKPYTDPSLAAFRKELAAVAQKKDRAALAKLVLAQDFFWLKEERQRRRQEDRHRGARDRAEPRGQGRLGLGDARASSPPTRPPHPIRTARTRCARRPARSSRPTDLEKLVERPRPISATGASPPRRTSRCTPPRRPNAPVIEKLGMIFVRVMPDIAPNASQEFMRDRRPRPARSASCRPRRSIRSARTSSATARTPRAPGRSSA